MKFCENIPNSMHSTIAHYPKMLDLCFGLTFLLPHITTENNSDSSCIIKTCTALRAKSPDFVGGEQLHSETQKGRTASFMQSWSGYFSLRRANCMWHWKEKKTICTCRSHAYLLQQTLGSKAYRAPRIRNRRTEARNYLLSQRTSASGGREEKG